MTLGSWGPKVGNWPVAVGFGPLKPFWRVGLKALGGFLTLPGFWRFGPCDHGKFLALGPGVVFWHWSRSHEQQVNRSLYSEDNFYPLWGLYG